MSGLSLFLLGSPRLERDGELVNRARAGLRRRHVLCGDKVIYGVLGWVKEKLDKE